MAYLFTSREPQPRHGRGVCHVVHFDSIDAAVAEFRRLYKDRETNGFTLLVVELAEGHKSERHPTGELYYMPSRAIFKYKVIGGP